MIKLVKPLKDIYITQYFGENKVGKGFYAKFGLSSDNHNGIDLRCRVGCLGVGTHEGIAILKESESFGKYIVLNNVKNGEGYDTIYGHLSEFLVKDGDFVKQNQPMYRTGKSGTASNGPHLHFAYRDWRGYKVADLDNGYLGSKDPSMYMDKNWDKDNAYHRYGRKREYLAEIKMRFHNQWLHKQLLKTDQLKKIYDNSFINALVYGGWGFEELMDEAFTEWRYNKKEDYKKGTIAFT